MNNEDILKAAQAQASQEGEFEIDKMKKNLASAFAVVVIILIIMVIFEILLLKKMDYGKPSIVFLCAGIADYLDGRSFSKKGKLVRGLVEIAFALFFLTAYVGTFL